MSKIALNTTAPDFTLTDFQGKEFRLGDFKTRSNVLLVFNRGFIWPFCREHMAQLRQDYNEFVQRHTEIVVIGPENSQAFSSYWHENFLPFIGLPDPKGSVLKLYGQEVNLFKLGRMPAQVIVDRAGIARFAHYGHSMSDIPANSELLPLLDDLNRSYEPAFAKERS